jgi:hypothetical protein
MASRGAASFDFVPCVGVATLGVGLRLLYRMAYVRFVQVLLVLVSQSNPQTSLGAP